MKRAIVTACAFLAMLALPVLALAQGVHAEKSGKTDLKVSRELIVGTTTLKPGEYRFQCIEIDGQHYLVVKSSDGDEVVRVPCEAEQLSAKIPISDFRSITRDGKQYLTAVRIKGEMVAHRVTPSPVG
jgi:hypothetical protein